MFLKTIIGAAAIVLQIAERAEQFRQQIGSLELLASTHNGIVQSLTILETPLMEPMLAKTMELVQQQLMASNTGLQIMSDMWLPSS